MRSLYKDRISGFVIGFLVVGMFFLASDRVYQKVMTLRDCLTQVSFVCLGQLDGMER